MMASNSSDLICDTVHKKIEPWSVYKCVFCNTLLDGKSKILDCLHAICNNCMNKEMDITGLRCVCLTVTKSSTIDYPLVLPDISENTKTKICDNSCESEANRVCVYCKTYYCKPCSEVHLSSNKDHNPNMIMHYPIVKELVMCSICSEKCGEVYCTKCSVVVCALCYLTLHRTHSYKNFDIFCEEIQASLSEELIELKKSNECLVFCVDQTKKQIQKLESKKKSIIDEIDVVLEKLHLKLNTRAAELKQLVLLNFTDSVGKIHDNRKIFLDIQKKVKYYIKLVEIILEHYDIHVIIKLSKLVLNKLGELLNQATFNGMSGLKIDLKYSSDDSDKTLENCISAIKNLGNITSEPVFSLSEIYNIKTLNDTSQNFINLQATNLFDKRILKEEVLNSSANFGAESDSSDYEPPVECSCCNQWAEKLIECISCGRNFHNDCHIPAILPDINVCNPVQTTWVCTLCQDISKYAKVLNQKDLKDSILVTKNEFKIMERILMELYCQNNDSEHYRECPSEEIYPVYYQRVPFPLSLNDVKNIFKSDQSYTDLIKFLKDLRQVFLNGHLYYPSHDPYYDSATKLLTTLHKLISHWIPKLDQLLLR